MLSLLDTGKSQIALEFIIVYSFVLVIFIIIFSVIATQRSAALGQQEYSLLQLQAQNIASYINQAIAAGNGYSATVPLVSNLGMHYYNVSISSTGVVIVSTKLGTQIISAYGFSSAKSIIINGTLQQSSNGISIYRIQSIRGSMGVSNIKGVIYINMQPASVASLAQSAGIVQASNAKGALFSLTSNNYIIPGNGFVWMDAGDKHYSISIWVDPTSQNGVIVDELGQTSINSGWHDSLIELVNGNVLVRVWPRPCLNIGPVPLNSWSNIALTYDGGTYKGYINGVFVNSGSGSRGVPGGGGTPMYYALGPLDSQSCNSGGSGAYFSGSMLNYQFYNNTLTQQQVAQIYNGGIGGVPSNLNNTILWWPLNGNLNDFSGYSNPGIPNSNSISYNDVEQLDVRALASSGPASNTIVGFVSSEGYMSTGGGNSISNYTNGNGLSVEFITSNGVLGSGNVVIDTFNGNLTSANLIAWWPLDTGYGNVIYDLSGGYTNGAFGSGQLWSVPPNQTNFLAAAFPGNPSSVSNSNTADGFITVNSTQSLLNIVSNSSFTLAAWIYYEGPTSHWQGVFGNINHNMQNGNSCTGSCGGGFQLVGSIGSNPGNVLYVNTSAVPFPSGTNSFPKNTWEMVTAEYNGSTGLATVYLNNTVFASNVLPKNIALLQNNPYYIGDDAWQTGGLDTFNGIVSDVQLYSRYLTPSQVNALYKLGITSNPLNDAGLISWWPLAGSAQDYTANNNTGFASYNILYTNVQYNSVTPAGSLQQVPAAAFNGLNNIAVPFSNKLVTAGSKALSVSLWFMSYNSPYSNFDSGLVSGSLPGIGYDVQLCGGSTCGFTGINGSIGNGASFLSPSVQYHFTFNSNTWYELTETFNQTGWSIFLNGNRVNTGTYGSAGVPTFVTSSGSVKIGSGGFGGHFNGQIADVQVYGTQLTPFQVQQLYTQGLPIRNALNISLG